MRNMSFALTTPQVRAGTKDVTRRVGWRHLNAGDLIQPVVKGMGLRPGEKVERIGGPVRVLSVQRELLHAIARYPNEGMTETRREGFPDMRPQEFIAMFCGSHRGCTPETEITRIEFSYDKLEGWEPMPTAPKDGTRIDLLIRHATWHYEKPEARDQWQGPCPGEWLDFNGGGWCWSGHCGSPIAWRPAA
jgi:hypothetical protein